jgi:hypothetical protein
MLTHPTLDQLRALRLDGMAQAFIELEAQEEVHNLAYTEWLALLLDRESADRNTRRFQTRPRTARLRHSQAAIEDVDYRSRGGPTRHCSSSWHPLVGSPSTAIFLSPVHAASANRGYPVRWPKRHAATAILSTTHACRACSPISTSPTAMVALRGCSECWSRSISWCSTIGDPIASPRANGAISWKSSRTATAVAPS